MRRPPEDGGASPTPTEAPIGHAERVPPSRATASRASSRTAAQRVRTARWWAVGATPVALLGVVVSVSAAAAVLSGGVASAPVVTVTVALPVGWSYLAVGHATWRRRPDSSIGWLLLAVAFAWFTAGFSGSDVTALHTVGLALTGLYDAILVHLLLAFPTGRVIRRRDRALVAAAYGTALIGQLLIVSVSEPAGPTNLLLVHRDDRLAELFGAGVVTAGATITLLAAAVLLRRWRAASPRQRRALAPVLLVGAVLAVSLAAGLAVGQLPTPDQVRGAAAAATAITVGALPWAFLAGLARARFFAATTVLDLLTRLDPPGSGRVQPALADVLQDPDLRIAYWLPDRAGYVDAVGNPVQLSAADRAVTPVQYGGNPVAVLLHDPALLQEPGLVQAVGAAVALALRNERLEAQLRARVTGLRDSRRRLVEAGEAERRQVERDLHDGAQARLVALRVLLGLARRQVESDADAADLLDSARTELDAALAELRDLARGLHPAVLATRGLPVALASLAATCTIPVDLATVPPQRLPATVESAIYFLVAEALTNTAKHAAADHARIDVRAHPTQVTVQVCDDGVGGADPSGSGLTGLAARVAALDGRLQISSPPGAGTTVQAYLPLRPDPQ